MPANYGDQLTPAEVDAIAAFLYQESHAKG